MFRLLGDSVEGDNPAAPENSMSGCSCGVALLVASGLADIALGSDHLTGIRVSLVSNTAYISKQAHQKSNSSLCMSSWWTKLLNKHYHPFILKIDINLMPECELWKHSSRLLVPCLPSVQRYHKAMFQNAASTKSTRCSTFSTWTWGA